MNANVIDIGRPVQRATYSVPEIATMLGISRASAYARLRTGEIPARRIGARWIIARGHFDTWLSAVPDLTVAEQVWR